MHTRSLRLLCLLFPLASGAPLPTGPGPPRELLPEHARQLRDGSRIVGGVEITRGQYPHLLSIQSWLGKHYCAGTLISQTWVMTAAHCVQGVPRFRLVAGAHSLLLASIFTGAQIRFPQRVIVHESYNPITYENDIALIELNRPVTNVQPISALASSMLPYAIREGQQLVTAGWGRTGEEGSLSDVPLHTTVPLVSAHDCKDKLGSSIRTDLMICAGRVEGGMDACQGDSGGPLLLDEGSGRHTIVGIVSWGIGCARPDKPGVYTRVSAFGTWVCLATGVGCDDLVGQAFETDVPAPPPAPPYVMPQGRDPGPVAKILARLLRLLFWPSPCI